MVVSWVGVGVWGQPSQEPPGSSWPWPLLCLLCAQHCLMEHCCAAETNSATHPPCPAGFPKWHGRSRLQDRPPLLLQGAAARGAEAQVHLDGCPEQLWSLVGAALTGCFPYRETLGILERMG